MGPLAREITGNLNKLLDVLRPAKGKTNEKIIFYTRLYTDLIRAEENLKENGFFRLVNYLKVVRHQAKNCEFSDEEVYMKRIHSIANEILNNMDDLKKQIKQSELGDAYADPYHARTKLQLAQNICILRILKQD